MEYPEANRLCALKFLETFTSSEKVPAEDEPLPLRPNWPDLLEEELEAECLDMTKRYLNTKQCPGLFAYHVAAECCRRLKLVPVENLKDPAASEGGESESGEPGTTVLSGNRVARELLTVLVGVCQEWVEQFPKLTAPKDKPELSIFGMKNTRRKMEDRYAMCLDVNSLYGLNDMPAQTYYAVFDGHNGEAAAVYASIHLLTNIVRDPAFKEDPSAAIKAGVRKTDVAFCKKSTSVRRPQHPSPKGVKSGTTAVFTLIRGDKLYVAWLGDSQAILVRKGKPLQLVEPHKPEREDEQKRIEEAGGMVIWMGAWRVNGNLSVSRAIGDAKDKLLVIGEADVETFDLDGTEDYLVVACDGVWDVVSEEEAVKCVSTHLSREGGSKASVAEALVKFAKSEGSGDNMTAIVVYFKGFQPPVKQESESETSCDTSCDKQCDSSTSSCDKQCPPPASSCDPPPPDSGGT